MLSLLLLLVACTPSDPVDTGPAELQCGDEELLDGDRCVPVRCGLGPWGAIDQADLWVGEGELGSITEALAQASAGDVIAVAEGTWPEALEVDAGLDEVALVGRCPELTRVQAPEGHGITLRMDVGERVNLSGLTLAGPDLAGLVWDGILHLQQVEVEGGAMGALVASGPRSRLELDQTVVRAANEPMGDAPWGAAIYADTGGDVVANEVEVVGGTPAAFMMVHEGSKLTAQDLRIWGVAVNPTLNLSASLWIIAGAQAQVDGLYAEGGHMGASVDGSTLTLTQAEITGTTELSLDMWGQAVGAFHDSKVYVGQSHIHGCGWGLNASQSSLVVEEVVVDELVPLEFNQRSWGLTAFEAEVEVRGLQISGATGVALDSWESTGTLEGLHITDTQPMASGVATAVQHLESGAFTASDVEVDGYHSSGIIVSGEGASLDLSDFAITGGSENLDGEGAAALGAQESAHVVASHGLIKTVMGQGVVANGATIELDDVEIHEVAEDEERSLGAVAAEGGTLVLQDVVIDQVDGVGLSAEGATVQGQRVELTGSAGLAGGGGGGCAQSVLGGDMLLQDSTLQDCRGAGLWVVDASTAVLEGVDFLDCYSEERGPNGMGVMVWEGSELVAHDLLVDGAETVGVVAGYSSSAQLTQATITRVYPWEREVNGMGLVALADSVVVADQVAISEVSDVGALATDPGTSLTLTQVTLSDVHPPASLQSALGLKSQLEAELVVSGLEVHDIEGPALDTFGGDLLCSSAVLERTSFAGVTAKGGRVHLEDTTIDGVSEHPALGGGVGISTFPGEVPTTLEVLDCHVQGAPLAAAYLEGAGSFLLTDSTLVAGEGVELAPGVLAHGDAVYAMGTSQWEESQGLLLSGVTLQGATGTGLLLRGGSATLEGVQFSANSLDWERVDCEAGASPVLDQPTESFQECPEREPLMVDVEWDILLSEVVVER